jgi:FixJ family two-component response regulator
MTVRPPTVFVLDGDVTIRDALRLLIRSIGLNVECFGSPFEFLQKMQPDVPGCLVLDVRLPGKSGLDLQRELAESNIAIPIIFITAHGDIPLAVRAMKAGAVEFLTKPFRDQDLLDAIQVALERDRAWRQHQSETAMLRRRFESLTPRERQVFPLVISGLPNKQVAAEIGATEGTVKVHRSQLMKKMGADSLPDLVRMAEKIGAHGSPRRRNSFNNFS